MQIQSQLLSIDIYIYIHESSKCVAWMPFHPNNLPIQADYRKSMEKVQVFPWSRIFLWSNQDFRVPKRSYGNLPVFSPEATALLPIPPALDFGRIAGVLNGEAKRKVERLFERLGFRLNEGNLFVDWNHEWWLMMIDDDWWWLVMIGDDGAVGGDSDYKITVCLCST